MSIDFAITALYLPFGLGFPQPPRPIINHLNLSNEVDHPANSFPPPQNCGNSTLDGDLKPIQSMSLQQDDKPMSGILMHSVADVWILLSCKYTEICQTRMIFVFVLSKDHSILEVNLRMEGHGWQISAANAHPGWALPHDCRNLRNNLKQWTRPANDLRGICNPLAGLVLNSKSSPGWFKSFPSSELNLMNLHHLTI